MDTSVLMLHTAELAVTDHLLLEVTGIGASEGRANSCCLVLTSLAKPNPSWKRNQERKGSFSGSSLAPLLQGTIFFDSFLPTTIGWVEGAKHPALQKPESEISHY